MMAEVEEPSAPIEIPAEFFTDILPRVEDLAELKLILHVIHLAGRRSGTALPLADLYRPQVLRDVAGHGSPEPAEERLQRTIDRAVADGWLLRLTVRTGEDRSVYLVPATKPNRQIVDRLRDGDPQATEALAVPANAEVAVYRPNLFALYEHHIGPLTPLVAEQLRDAERSYPRTWLEEAIRRAVRYNRRSLRYITAILTRWEESGGPDGFSNKRP